MARAFTNEDAKILLDEFSVLEGQINSFLQAQEPCAQKVSANALTVNNSIPLSNLIVQDLENGQTAPRNSKICKNLFTAIYVHNRYEAFKDELQMLVNRHQADSRQAASALKAATSSVRWFFSGSKAKANAISAYQSLSDLLHGEYGTAIRSIADAWENLSFQENHPAEQDFEEHPSNYQSAIQSYRGIGTIPALKQLLDRQQTVIDKYSNIVQELNSAIESTEQNILNAATRYRGVVLLSELAKHDVEALNQKQSGLRTKALRDAGYATVNDVYCSTASNLASIHGISPEAAKSIKKAAREIANNLSDGLRIRISVDEPSDEAAALLHALRLYQDLQVYRQRVNDLAANVQAVQQSYNLLSELQSNICWVVATDAERRTYSSAYRTSSEWLISSPAAQINQLSPIPAKPSIDSAGMLWEDFARNSAAYYAALEEVVPGALCNGDTLFGLPEDLAREIQDQTFFPQGLKVTLRRYQEWGVKYILHQERVLLGDEMGLGKTIQAIATMVSLRNTGAKHFLVVCPASVLPNWCKEIDAKSEFHSTKIHGYGRQAAFDEWISSGGVAVTNYETLPHINIPQDFHFDLLIVDEAHYIKNTAARRSKSIRSLAAKTDRLLFMTGTPLENKVEEMISLVGVLQPNIVPIIKDLSFMSTAPQFREHIAPVYYRRKQEDVLSELPEKQVIDDWCELSPQEEAQYEKSLMTKNQHAIRKVSWDMNDPQTSTKAKRLKEIVGEAKEEGRKVLVFSFYREIINMVRSMLGEACAEPITGSVPVERRQEIIDEFETMPEGSVLPAQIGAGGTGLNIQSASVVIICEPQLKPSIENQAIARAHRMGQTRKVLVYRLLAANTIDERINDLLIEKQMLFDEFADKSVAADATKREEAELDTKTINTLIQQEIDRINAKNGNMTPITASVDMGENTIQKDDTPAYNAPANGEQPAKALDGPDLHISGEAAYESKPIASPMTFLDVDALIAFLKAQGIEYVDKRDKAGCLWIKAEGFSQNATVAGQPLKYSKSPKALHGAPGYYIS